MMILIIFCRDSDDDLKNAVKLDFSANGSSWSNCGWLGGGGNCSRGPIYFHCRPGFSIFISFRIIFPILALFGANFLGACLPCRHCSCNFLRCAGVTFNAYHELTEEKKQPHDHDHNPRCRPTWPGESSQWSPLCQPRLCQSNNFHGQASPFATRYWSTKCQNI